MSIQAQFEPSPDELLPPLSPAAEVAVLARACTGKATKSTSPGTSATSSPTERSSSIPSRSAVSKLCFENAARLYRHPPPPEEMVRRAAFNAGL